MINEIFNGDSASEIRAKLNEMINIVNYYSSSQFAYNPDPGAGGDPGMGGGDDSSNYQITVYVGMTPPPLQVDSDAMTACSSINNGYQSTVYIQKDPMNMGGTQVAEVGDTLYEFYPYTSPLGMGYVGMYDMYTMSNKYIELSPSGQIVSINSCV